MNNTRYALAVRVAAGAGFVAAAVLVVNASKRAGLIPTNDVTQLVAPLAQIAAMVLLLGVVAWTGARGWRLAAIIANAAVLAGLVGAEFVTNLVFSEVDGSTVDQLLAGPLGVALTVVSVAFLVTSVLLVVALWSELPRWALALYGLGAIPVSLRSVVPEAALDLGLLGIAIAVVGFATTMLRVPTPDRGGRGVPLLS